MDEKILGSTFLCECGRTHCVPIQHVVYADDAVQKLPCLSGDYAGGRKADLVADSRTLRAAGEQVARAFADAGWDVRATVIQDPACGDPVCDEATRAEVEGQLRADRDILVAVGSGVISDLCKWITCDSGGVYVVVATAASMNGYSSENIAPSIKGVKRVLSGTVPRIIVADPRVIESAPLELTTAGLGDVLAKPVSITDWKINHLLFDEYYCPFCARLIEDLEPAYMNAPEGIRERDPAAIDALFRALVYSGISMTMAGTSFPASGGEHLISHVLDMRAGRDGTGHDYHGRQVGVGTIFAAAVYERLLGLENPDFRARTEETDSEYWGPLTKVVEEEHAGKRKKARKAEKRLKERGAWDRLRDTIRIGCIPASRIKDCLRKAGGAHRIDQIGCSRNRFVQAVGHCHQIRARYTVIDLARTVGVLPGAIEEIVDEYLAPTESLTG